MKLVLIICISTVIICAIIFNHLYKEHFIEYETWRKIDQAEPKDTVWDTAYPLAAETITSYSSLDNKTLQQVLTDNVNSLSTFPTKAKLNNDYEWAAFKPRVIPGNIYNTCISNFMALAKIKDRYNLIILRDRVINANITKNYDSYLLTFQLALRQPNAVYGYVIEFTVLVNIKKKEYIFNNAQVTGIIHEQNDPNYPVAT